MTFYHRGSQATSLFGIHDLAAITSFWDWLFPNGDGSPWDKRLNRHKGAYCQPGGNFELHAAEFASFIKEQNEISGFAGMSWTDQRARVAAISQAKIEMRWIS